MLNYILFLSIMFNFSFAKACEQGSFIKNDIEYKSSCVQKIGHKNQRYNFDIYSDGLSSIEIKSHFRDIIITHAKLVYQDSSFRELYELTGKIKSFNSKFSFINSFKKIKYIEIDLHSINYRGLDAEYEVLLKLDSQRTKFSMQNSDIDKEFDLIDNSLLFENEKLEGSCKDSPRDYQLAFNFAVSDTGLDFLFDSEAHDWAKTFLSSHSCGSINLYKSRFYELTELAEHDLEMHSFESVVWASELANYRSIKDINSMKTTFPYIFYFTNNSIDLNHFDSLDISKKWLENLEICGGPHSIIRAENFYNSIYRSSLYSRSEPEAKSYAIKNLKPFTSCYGYFLEAL